LERAVRELTQAGMGAHPHSAHMSLQQEEEEDEGWRHQAHRVTAQVAISIFLVHTESQQACIKAVLAVMVEWLFWGYRSLTGHKQVV
jgi:hypothetical protein